MNNESQIAIEKYWVLIQRRKYLFITISLVVLSLIIWGSYFMPEKYEAKSTVFIEQSVIKNLVQGISGGSRTHDDMLRGLEHTMLSKKVLLEVIDELDLDATVGNEVELASMLENLSENTYINSHSQENFFTVSYRGEDPRMVQAYVNTLVDKYIDTITGLKREDAYGASKFLSEQIEYYKDKIAGIEEKLVKFRREEGIYLSVDERTLVSSIKKNREELENVSMEIKKLEAKKKKIEQQLTGEAPFTLAMIESQGGNSLTARLKSLEQKLQVLLTKYTENYPEVLRVKIEIDEIKKTLNNAKLNQESGEIAGSDLNSGMSMMNPIYQQLKEELLATESEIDSLKANKEILNSRIKRAEDELKNIPQNKKILASLERDRDTYQTLYEQLLAKLGQAEVNEQVEAQNKGETFKIIERAGMPRKPVSPDRVLIILFGMLAGVAAGVGGVLLKENLDSSIRDTEMLKSQLKMKVLAVIPEIISENDIRKKQTLDRGIYAFSIVYLLIIGGVFIKEFVNRFFGV